MYHLYGEAAIRSLCEDLTLNARQHLYMAGESQLADRLERLTPRGVKLHRAELVNLPSIAAEGQRAFLLARDGEAALIAHFIEDGQHGEPHGVHTHNPVIIHLIEGYVNLVARPVTP